MARLPILRADGSELAKVRVGPDGKRVSNILEALQLAGHYGRLCTDEEFLTADDIVFAGEVAQFVPADSDPSTGEDIEILMNFAKYAAGKLKFKNSQILQVPPPFAIFRKDGEVFPLYVRKAYSQLSKCIHDRQEKIKLFSVQGTSGIGKSVFGMLWVLMQAQEGRRVLWYISNQFYLFDFTNREQPAVKWLSKDNATRCMWNKDLWLVADGAYEYQFSGQCYVLQVCSFNKKNYHEFTKTPGVQILYHPVWTEDELLGYVDKCEELEMETVNKEDIRKIFSILGGIPRYTLHQGLVEDDESTEAGDPIKEVKDAINRFGGDVFKLFQVLAGQYVEQISDKLIHCTTEDCISRRMVFASDYVKEQMFTLAMKKDKIEFRRWLETYQDDIEVGSLWGGLFETFAHQVLCRGGSFTMKKLHADCSVENLRMNSRMKKFNFSNATDLGRLDKEQAFGIARKGFTAIDSLFFDPGRPPALFQVFKRQKGEAHGFVFKMLQNIDEAMQMPAYKSVCVVPQRLADKTQLQPYYRTDKKAYQFKNRKDRICRDKFAQYVLPLDFSWIEKESVWKDL